LPRATDVTPGKLVRTLRLRDLDGAPHVFRCSEARGAHNLTKAFSHHVSNRRLKQAFDEAGAEIPFPRMTVPPPEPQLGRQAAR
jgi:hypothetical protein